MPPGVAPPLVPGNHYGHNYRIFVKKGQLVKRGQVIAAVGTSGRATGPHLHYEVRVKNRSVDPLRYILPSN